jgi:hypothetical protein
MGRRFQRFTATLCHACKESIVKIAVQLHPANGAQPKVQYRWDPDTDILSAQLMPRGVGDGMSGSVGLEGADGSWVILDVASGSIAGVEVAVWPEVRKLASIAPPATVEDAHVVVPSRRSQPDIASLEMNAVLVAETDHEQRNFHFRLGKPKGARTVRLAADLLLDVDEKSQISGLWLLNVPLCPAES